MSGESPIDRLPAEVEEAARRIAPYARRTYVEQSAYLSDRTKRRVYLKLENLQHTGSFKVRGALNKLLSLTPDERAEGVVAASTGNHGAAVAYALSRLSADGVVYVPGQASPAKIRAIERFGVDLERVPGDPIAAEQEARRVAEATGRAYISPYNDWAVVAGQGTVGLELTEQCEALAAIVVALGGGGLASGVAAYYKSRVPEALVVAVSPENSAVMARSVEAGRILELESRPTLSDGTAGGVEPAAVTFEAVRRWVDDYVTVSEEEIGSSLREFLGEQRMLIEGAAAAAVAGLVKTHDRLPEGPVAVVLCGGNIGLKDLENVLNTRADPVTKH